MIQSSYYTLESVNPLTGERYCHAAGRRDVMHRFRKRYAALAAKRGHVLRVFVGSRAGTVYAQQGELNRDPGPVPFETL